MFSQRFRPDAIFKGKIRRTRKRVAKKSRGMRINTVVSDSREIPRAKRYLFRRGRTCLTARDISHRRPIMTSSRNVEISPKESSRDHISLHPPADTSVRRIFAPLHHSELSRPGTGYDVLGFHQFGDTLARTDPSYCGRDAQAGGL